MWLHLLPSSLLGSNLVGRFFHTYVALYHQMHVYIYKYKYYQQFDIWFLLVGGDLATHWIPIIFVRVKLCIGVLVTKMNQVLKLKLRWIKKIYINIFYYIREHSIPHTARCWQSLKIDRCWHWPRSGQPQLMVAIRVLSYTWLSFKLMDLYLTGSQLSGVYIVSRASISCRTPLIYISLIDLNATGQKSYSSTKDPSIVYK